MLQSCRRQWLICAAALGLTFFTGPLFADSSESRGLRDSDSLDPSSADLEWARLDSFEAPSCPEEPDVAVGENEKGNPKGEEDSDLADELGPRESEKEPADVPYLRVPLVRSTRVVREDPTLATSNLRPEPVGGDGGELKKFKKIDGEPFNAAAVGDDDVDEASRDHHHLPRAVSLAYTVDAPEVIFRTVRANKVAVVLVDTWDRHWCRPAETRLAELYRRMNVWLGRMRDAGAHVVFAPYDVELEQQYPAQVEAMSRHVAAARSWEMGYNKPQYSTAHEGGERGRGLEVATDGLDGAALPFRCDQCCDDGGDDPVTGKRLDDSKRYRIWSRINPNLDVCRKDLATTSPADLYAFLVGKGIELVLYAGGATNQCIISRSVGVPYLCGARGDPTKRVPYTCALVQDLSQTSIPTGMNYESAQRKMFSFYRGNLIPTTISTAFEIEVGVE